MTIPFRRSLNEVALFCKTASVGASPVAAYTIVPCKGKLVRTYVVAEGTTTGTISVAVAINAGSETGTPLSLAAGNAGNKASDNTKFGSGYVQEGDVISFTPSGGGGATIPATFVAIIRKD